MSNGGAKSEVPSDPSHIFELAERFRESTQVLDVDYSRGSTMYCSTPGVVLDAFAVELYLKCLNVLDHGKRPRKIHRFDDLFELLAQTTQLDLRLRWHLNIQADAVLRNIDFINPEAPPVCDFWETLRVGSNAFESSRYIFEQSGKRASGWFYTHLIRECVRDIATARLTQTSEAIHSSSGDVVALRPNWIALVMRLARLSK